jgi:probable rRNA maturation factor
MSPVSLEINNQYSRLVTPEMATVDLFEALMESGKFPIGDGELSIAFVDDATIARIHADFMDDPSPTDVITFPAEPSMESAGEIIVSVDHAHARARELGETFSRELSLYLIHGWLHLAGFDDRNEEDRSEMRAAEQVALDLLQRTGKLPEYRLQKQA